MRNRDIENKKILILGGGVAALDVVNEAKKLGLYVNSNR